jgi:hypothetical protein
MLHIGKPRALGGRGGGVSPGKCGRWRGVALLPSGDST